MAHSFLVRFGRGFARPAHPDLIAVKSSQPVPNTPAVDQPDVWQRTTSSEARFPERSVLSSRSVAASDNPTIERLPDGITLDTPLRLGDIVRFGFPAGGMTVSGLRREINRGRLDVELIAGKQFTTLANIERMRKLCRVEAKAPDCGSDRHGAKGGAQPLRQFGSSRTAAGISPRDALRARLKRSRPEKPNKP